MLTKRRALYVVLALGIMTLIHLLFILPARMKNIEQEDAPTKLFKHLLQKRHLQRKTTILITDVQKWFNERLTIEKFSECSVPCEATVGDLYKPVKIPYDMTLAFPFLMNIRGRGTCSSLTSALDFKDSSTDDRFLRLYGQIYIEPNNEFSLCADTNDGQFEKEPLDISINYHRNSTLRLNYYSYSKIPTIPRSKIIDRSKERFKGFCVFISNCKTFGAAKRIAQVEELSNFVPMKSFGYCLHNADTELSKVEQLGECMFYVSFENSRLEDYVTEKFFDAFIATPAPLMVYLGAPNIEDFSPTDTNQHPAYIDASKFDSMQSLGEYMNKLINDPIEYDKYFEWRKTGDPMKDFGPKMLEQAHNDWDTMPCRICTAVAEMQEARKVLATYNIVPQAGNMKIDAKSFKMMLKNVNRSYHSALKQLYDIAYGRYWRKNNHNTEWNK